MSAQRRLERLARKKPERSELGIFGCASIADAEALRRRLPLCIDCKHIISYTFSQDLLNCEIRGLISPPEEPICLQRHRTARPRKFDEIKKLGQYMQKR